MNREKPLVPRPILAQLQVHFDGLIPKNLFLVSPNTQYKKVYHISGSTAVKDNITIAFRIALYQDEHICDYFLNADGYTEHRKYVVERDEVSLLPNFEGQYGDSDIIDDGLSYQEHMRIVKHDAQVRKMLIKKGFIKR